MSDNWLIIFPTDPFAIPSVERQNAAVKLLEELRPESAPVDVETSDSPMFQTGVSNFETVYCPFCGTDIKDWWFESMHKWWEEHRDSLAVVTPCCNRPTSLNDLDYVRPQGFSCVAIEVMNPNADLEPFEREQVEAVLGVPVRLFWRHI